MSRIGLHPRGARPRFTRCSRPLHGSVTGFAARTGNLLRMSTARNGEVLKAGELEIRPDEHRAVAAGRTLTLSLRELELLAALVRREGRIVQRDELYETVWGAPLRSDDRSVDVYVHKLRAKLERRCRAGASSTRTSGFGYRFQPEPSHPFHNAATGP